MTDADVLARTLSEIERRLRAVERGSQMPYSSVEIETGEEGEESVSVDVTSALTSGEDAAATVAVLAEEAEERAFAVEDVQAVADDAQAAADAAAEAAALAQETADAAQAAGDAAAAAAAAAEATAAAAQTAADDVADDVALIPGQIAAAKAEAISTAATDAQTKATAAQNAATTAAALDAQAKADTAKAEALTAAAVTAQEKADAAAATAKAEALTAAAATAQTKADLAQAAAINAAQAYVQSRGTDLITNGTGISGNATNFSTFFNFNGVDVPTGATGSFYAKSGAAHGGMIDEFIVYDPTKPLRFSFMMRQTVAGAVSKAYGFLAPFDASGNAISPQHYMRISGTDTTLAAALNPGDTTIKLTSASGWYGTAAKPAGAATYFRSIMFWDYVDPTGKAWPAYSYTRNVLGSDMYADGGVDAATGIITLRAPYSGPAKPAGTQVSQPSAGGSYLYMPSLTNGTVPEAWTTYADTFPGGIFAGPQAVPSTGGTTWAGGMPPGTAKVKAGWLLNYAPTSGLHAVAKVSLSDAAAASYAAHNITATQITDNAVTSPKILAGAVIAGKIATDAVTANTILAGAVVAGKIATDAVLADNIKAGEITAAKLAAGTITAASGVIGSIDAAKITVGKITASQMQTGTITAASGIIAEIDAAKITVGKITAAQMQAGTITAASGVIGSIDAAKITVGTIQASQLAADAIDGKTITGSTLRTAATGERIEILGGGTSSDNAIRFIMGGGGVYDTATLRSTQDVNSSRLYTGLLGATWATGVDLFHRAEVQVDNYGEASLMLRWAPNGSMMSSGQGIPAAYVKTKRVAGSTAGDVEIYAGQNVLIDAVTTITLDAPNIVMTPEGWTAPTLTGSWANYVTGGHRVAGYRKVADGTVELRGLVKSGGTGTANAIFTLPSGYRPTQIEIFNQSASTGVARVDVDNLGRVFVTTYYAGGTNAFVSLAGIRFATN